MVGSVYVSTVSRSTGIEISGVRSWKCKLNGWSKNIFEYIDLYKFYLTLSFIRIHFQSSFHKNLRRTVMRYVNLSSILAFTKIACTVEKRFPTYQSLVGARLLLPHEVS